jgi:hypothetical protein
LESANAAEGEIAVGGGGEAARILGDAGGEQGEIGEAVAVEWHIVQGALVEERGDGRRLRFDQGGRGGDGDIFVGAGDGEVEIEGGGGADIDVQLGSELRRHAFGYDASGVVAGGEQVEGKIAFGVAGRGGACGGRAVHDDN